MTKTKSVVGAGVLATAMLLAGTAQAVTVTNGSFEGGLTGWTVVSGTPVVHTTATGPFPAQQGTGYVEMDGGANATIRQNIFLDVGSYVMSFWYSPHESVAYASSEVRYRIGTLVTGRVRGGTAGDWVQVLVDFNIDSAKNYTLSFLGLGNADGKGGYIDNISIAAVPAPAAGFALLGGLGALLGLRRRKRA